MAVSSLQLPQQGLINSNFDFYTPLQQLGKQWGDNAATSTRRDAMAQVAQQLQDQGKITDYSPFFKSGDPNLLQLGQKFMQSQAENAQTAASNASLADYRNRSLANDAKRIGISAQQANEESWTYHPPGKGDLLNDPTPGYWTNTSGQKRIDSGDPAATGTGDEALYGRTAPAAPAAPAARSSPFPSVGKQSALTLPPNVANANASMDVPPDQSASSPSMLSSLASLMTPTAANAEPVLRAGQPSPADTSAAAIAARGGGGGINLPGFPAPQGDAAQPAPAPISLPGFPGGPAAAPVAAKPALPSWATAERLSTDPEQFKEQANDPIQPPKPGEHTMSDFRAAVRGGVSGDDLYQYLPTMIRNRVKGIIEGRVSASGVRSAQVQQLLTLAQTIDTNFSDNLWKARSTMWNDLMGKSGANNLGGALANGETAMGHLGQFGDAAIKLKNFNGPPIPYGGAIGAEANKIYNDAAQGERRGDLNYARDILGRYGTESSKFYAGTATTGEERQHASKNQDPQNSTSFDQAAYLGAEADALKERFQSQENHIRKTMGDEFLQKNPVFTPELQAKFAKVAAQVAVLKNQKPGGDVPDTGQPTPVGPITPNAYKLPNGKSVLIRPAD